jgi:hypothetical protein
LSSVSSYIGAPIATAFFLAIFCKRVTEPVSEKWKILSYDRVRKKSAGLVEKVHSFTRLGGHAYSLSYSGALAGRQLQHRSSRPT